ncbi:MAG: ATP-binding protein, partial [Acidobacteria bacterium]|nr:ATP-binding protein [Acidobacteriota bacterium]
MFGLAPAADLPVRRRGSAARPAAQDAQGGQAKAKAGRNRVPRRRRQSEGGRRRPLQRCLRALANPSDHYGVFLHGMGGSGKSTIAARLCRRHEAMNLGVQRAVIVGPLDEFRVRQKLSDRYGGMQPVVDELNRGGIEFKHQLKNVIEMVEEAGKPLLLVLDDFEQNIPAENVADGSLSLAAGAYGTLEALCFAFGESAAASRLIVTCRYFKKETLPPNRF